MRFLKLSSRFFIKFVLVSISLFLVFVNFSGKAFAEIDYDEEINNKEAEKQEKIEELEESQNRQYSFEQEGLSLAQKIQLIEQDLIDKENEIIETQRRIHEYEQELARLEEEKQARFVVITDVSNSIYKESHASLLEIVLSTLDVSEILRTLNFRKFSIQNLVVQVEELYSELDVISEEYEDLGVTMDNLEDLLAEMEEDKIYLANQKRAFEIQAQEEVARQSRLAVDIENITAEQEALIRAKQEATRQATTVGSIETPDIELPNPPFSPAYAFASMGYPHRVGLNQYGAYGRAIAGQTYDQILSAYYNANLVSNYSIPEEIYVEGYGSMSFEGSYMKGIAEMPTSWASSGGFEALKAQAVAVRSYALATTDNGQLPICTTQSCQVFYAPKVTNPAASEWHRAVEETKGQVLVYNGSVIPAYYASTAGGYTRLSSDFDVHWGSTAPGYIKRIKDADDQGRAYDGPSYGNSPWYYKVWYASSDVHPWLTEAETVDLLNSALLPSDYNSHLSHPDLGGWSYDQVESKLSELGITSISNINSLNVSINGGGYTQSIIVNSDSGLIEVDGRRLSKVYSLRSRGYLLMWSSLYDIVVR